MSWSTDARQSGACLARPTRSRYGAPGSPSTGTGSAVLIKPSRKMPAGVGPARYSRSSGGSLAHSNARGAPARAWRANRMVAPRSAACVEAMATPSAASNWHGPSHGTPLWCSKCSRGSGPQNMSQSVCVTSRLYAPTQIETGQAPSTCHQMALRGRGRRWAPVERRPCSPGRCSR